MFDMQAFLGPMCPTVRIVDVGAMWLGEDHVPYRALLKPGLSEVIGFEPVTAECDKLNAFNIPNHRYLPYFIGDGTERDFHLTNTIMTSSLYEPNTPLLRKFVMLHEQTYTKEVTRVSTRRLDDLAEVAGIDFLKVDVQGAELDVIRGATRLLRDTVVIESEVEFLEMYKGQPLFGDIDAALRALGFVFHTFQGMSGRCFAPLAAGANDYTPLRQVIWGNGVWVRDFMRFAELNERQLLTLAAVLHMVYDSYDLAALALRHADAKTGGDLWTHYVKNLTGGHVPPKPAID
jgi:FkbM family methyltransferase